MIDIKKVKSLISRPESKRHDFKQEWYSKHDKSELVKDIFSFVNTIHRKDCYLIIGVNDQQEVVGVEKDPNRKNQQNMIDFMRNLPIANEAIPKIYVQTISINAHKIDIIIIPNTKNVPVYLSAKYPSKGSSANIYPGQIFSREGDVNTSIDRTTHFYQAQALWEKRFRLDVPIQEQYKYILQDIKNWSYISEEKNNGFLYNLNPDFFIKIEEIDDINMNRVEAFSLDLIKVRIRWNNLKLRYRNITIKSLLIVYLDEARHAIVAPDSGVISTKSFRDGMLYPVMLENSFQYLVDNMINEVSNSFTNHFDDRYSLVRNNIVIYKNKEE